LPGTAEHLRETEGRDEVAATGTVETRWKGTKTAARLWRAEPLGTSTHSGNAKSSAAQPIGRMISASATTRLTQASQRGSEAVVACLLVVGADLARIEIAALALLTAAVIVAVGECLHTTVPIPLVADLAPAALRDATWPLRACPGGSGWRSRPRWRRH
jgi:hypothetical protein